MTRGTKLILVCGLPGTGKTTVAELIAKKTNSRILSTDVIRKEMISLPSYAEQEKKMVYGMLFSMAEMMLRDSKNVLLDGTFYSKELRESARSVAKRTKSDFHLVEVVCDEKAVRKRLEGRKEAGSASDADFEVYKKIKKTFEPIKEAHAVIDTSGEWEKEADALAANIR